MAEKQGIFPPLFLHPLHNSSEKIRTSAADTTASSCYEGYFSFEIR